MIRRPPRSTQSRSSAASDVYKRQLPGRSEERSYPGFISANTCSSGLTLGFIHAIRLFRQIVSTYLIGACATPTADTSILTDTTLPLQKGDIPQVLEQRRISPDFGERLLLNVTRLNIKIATGLDLAHVADETEPGPGQTPPGMRIQIPPLLRLTHLAGHSRVRVGMHLQLGQIPSFLPRPLAHDAVIVGSVRGFEEYVGSLLPLIHPVQSALVFFRRKLLRPQLLSTPSGNQKERMECDSVQLRS